MKRVLEPSPPPRDLDVIENELRSAQNRVLEWKEKQEELMNVLAALTSELNEHPEYCAQLAEDRDGDMRDGLGEFLYEEWVEKLGLTELSVERETIETRKHNIYNDIDTYTVKFKGGARCKSIEFDNFTDEKRYVRDIDVRSDDVSDTKPLTIARLWQDALAANAPLGPGNAERGAILAILRIVYFEKQDEVRDNDPVEFMEQWLNEILQLTGELRERKRTQGY